jgi:putative spermidine/putrescine transport system substrate-binding protein
MAQMIQISRRRLLKSATTAVVAFAAPAVISKRALADGDVLYVNTWGGSWTATETVAFFEPFTAKTGIRIETVKPVSMAKLKAEVQTHTYDWDVTNAGLVDFHNAVNEGLLEPIDYSVLDRQKIPAGTIVENGIAVLAFGNCLCYRKDKFPNGGPQSWADFWDVKRFPGTRALSTQSFTNLAFALLADGVPRDKLYPMDIDRAFHKLDQIKPHIKIWWSEGSQSQQLLIDGEVDMSMMWNARAQELVDRGEPIEMVWNESEIYFGYWFLAKGTPRARLGWQFIEFCAQAKPQAEFCSHLPYGPANPGAFQYISKETALKLPTQPEHLSVGFQPDAKWLAPLLPAIKERWATWVAS